MKYAFITIMAVAEILLITWYCITGFNIFLISAFLMLLICLIAWYQDSAITYEWRLFKSRNFPSMNFQPKYFSGKQHFYIICKSFELIRSETRIHKIVGVSKGYHHKNSVRLGYRRDGELLKPVVYIYSNWKRTAINMAVTFKEGDMVYIEWKIENGVLTTYLHNISTDVYQYSKHPVGFDFGFGYVLFPYGCNSEWNLRK